MSDKNAPKKNSPLKILMIPILGAALYWVMNKNQSEDGNVVSFESSKQVAAKETSKALSARREIIWPDLAIDDLLKHNPFSAGKQIANSDTGSEENAYASNEGPQQIEIAIYMESNRGPVAMIDGQIVHEGDRLANGQIITKLTPQFALLNND